MFDNAQNPCSWAYIVRESTGAATETTTKAPTAVFLDRNAKAGAPQRALIDGTILLLGKNLAK
jgi:hypothetical protein